MYDLEKFAAVADNFVYVHRALRRDLDRIVAEGPEVFQSDFPRFARILEKHSELEDDLFFAALEERAPGVTGDSTQQHEQIEALVETLSSGKSTDVPGELAQLREQLFQHLEDEENKIMPAMMDHFEASEIWALDAKIMEFCSPEFMQEMLPWWFSNLTPEDRVCVAQNMSVGVPSEILPVISLWIAEGVKDQDWADLVARVPELVSAT